MSEAPHNPDPVEFSLVICTRDRLVDLEPTLRCVLETLMEARLSWEVLVVDNGSTDATAEVAERMLAGRGRVVHESQQGLARARNTGIEAARGDVLVFIDDDISLSPSWVHAMEEGFGRAEVHALGGPVETIFPEGADRDYVAAVMGDGGTGTGNFMPTSPACEITGKGRVGFPRGGNMAMRREAVERAGGFNPVLGWGKRQIPGEETDLFTRMLAQGSRIWFDPRAQVLHRIQLEKLNWEYLGRWHRGYGRASVIMKGRLGLLMKVLKILDQVLTWMRYASLTLLPRARRSAKPWRKRWQAEGRLAQLLGID